MRAVSIPAFNVFIVAGLLASPVAAQTATPVAKPATEKKICRREAVTGSILGSRAVCHTKSEWLAIDRANEDRATNRLDHDRQLQNSGVSNTRTNGG